MENPKVLLVQGNFIMLDNNNRKTENQHFFNNKKFNNMKTELQKLVDICLPELKPENTESALRDLFQKADESTRKLAEIDPIANWFQQGQA